VFILYALVVGLFVGYLLGGRPSGLASLQFRWAPLILAGLAVQLLLFADPVAERIGQLGPPIYLGSTLAVLAGVVRNVHVAGMPLVVAGAASNVLAIAANGGFMPVSEAALRANGRTPATIYSNSRVLPDPALAPLTDIFAMPPWMPFANVFSIGDLLIGAGVAYAIARAMRADRDANEAGAAEQLPRTP
jgi:hypothetical protein